MEQQERDKDGKNVEVLSNELCIKATVVSVLHARQHISSDDFQKAGFLENGEGVLSTPSEASVQPSRRRLHNSHQFRYECPPCFGGIRV